MMELIVIMFALASICEEAGLHESAKFCMSVVIIGFVIFVLTVLAALCLFIAGKV